MGCHGGLNVPAVSVALSSETERLGDWPQQDAGRGALTVGNTGFGYGDTETVAYSERLMAEFARGLASHDVSAGQALLFAKQRYAATLGTGDDYDAKALAIGTFYGPPTYRVGTDGAVGAPALPVSTPSSSAAPLSLPFTIDVAPQEVSTARGRFWQVPGFAPLVVQRRPIQPRVTRDVTVGGRPARARRPRRGPAHHRRRGRRPRLSGAGRSTSRPTRPSRTRTA